MGSGRFFVGGSSIRALQAAEDDSSTESFNTDVVEVVIKVKDFSEDTSSTSMFFEHSLSHVFCVPEETLRLRKVN